MVPKLEDPLSNSTNSNSDESIKKTNAAREPFFLDLADIVIDTSNLNENEVTQQILSSLKSNNEN